MTGSRRGSYNVNIGVPAAIFVIIVLMIGLLFILQRGWESPAMENDQSQEDGWRAARESGADPLTFGESDTPVELVVFSDYQCPFCAHWSRDTLPALVDYVEEGDLRIVWRDVNLSGEASEHGARAVYAAALQDRFLDYHQALVADGRGASDEDLDEQALIERADELGLDVPRFTADMDSTEASQAINQNEAEGQAQGVTDAPAFLFNGEFVSGVQSTDAYITNLEAALEESATA